LHQRKQLLPLILFPKKQHYFLVLCHLVYFLYVSTVYISISCSKSLNLQTLSTLQRDISRKIKSSSNLLCWAYPVYFTESCIANKNINVRAFHCQNSSYSPAEWKWVSVCKSVSHTPSNNKYDTVKSKVYDSQKKQRTKLILNYTRCLHCCCTLSLFLSLKKTSSSFNQTHH